MEPSRPPRQTRGGRTKARLSLRTRTSERQRLRMSQSSPPLASNEQATGLEQLSSSENVVRDNNVATGQSVAQSNILNENTSVHETMYRPYTLEDGALLLQQAGESEVDPQIDYGNGTDSEDDRLGVHELAAQRRFELTREELKGVNPARAEIPSRID